MCPRIVSTPDHGSSSGLTDSTIRAGTITRAIPSDGSVVAEPA
jgi:hypothetical protein